jgi:GMP synthase (glutamine-hydrolysing)
MRPWLPAPSTFATFPDIEPCRPEPPVPASRDERPRKPVLIVLHQEHSTPGRIGRLLRLLGHDLDIRRPRSGDPLPETLEQHAGAVVFGGPMSANDPDAFIKAEIDWLDVPLKESVPLIGICLGAQMLAMKLGQPVVFHPAARVEMGYYRVVPTSAAAAVAAAPFPTWVYHWHSEGFQLPHGADCLAVGEDFACQAFAYGDAAFGLQFHPEVTYAMICRWTVRGAARLALPNAAPPHSHKEDWFLHDAVVARWTGAFLAAWLRRGRA